MAHTATITSIPDELDQDKHNLMWVHIHDASTKTDLKRKIKNKNLSGAVRSVLEPHAGRTYTLTYIDGGRLVLPQDAGVQQAVQFDPDTDADDIGLIPMMKIELTSAPMAFPSSMFLKRNHDKCVIKIPEFQLRDPQTDALLQFEKMVGPVQSTGSKHDRFFVVMPTGCGKTTVIALAPFMLNVDKVLIITPGNTIRDQIKKELELNYSIRHAIGKSGQLKGIKIEQLSGSRPSPTANVLIANIQAIIVKAKKRREVGDDEEELPSLRDFLQHGWVPDLVIVDEGHHGPAGSWKLLTEEAKKLNANVKFLQLTATPERGDGKRCGLEQLEQLYIYKRDAARQMRHIKQTTVKKVDVDEFKDLSKTKMFSDPGFIEKMLESAVTELLQLRALCADEPLRLLVNARSNVQADLIAEICNKMSINKGWGLKAAAITSKATKEDEEKLMERFEADDATAFQEDGPLDVAVKCKKMSEGHDNQWISVTAICMSVKTVGCLSQLHGRALRVNKKLKFEGGKLRHLANSLKVILVVPDLPDVMTTVTADQDGDDETTETLFAAPEPTTKECFRKMHKDIGKKKCNEGGFRCMLDNFDPCHDKCDERRESWDPIPAEFLAETVFATDVSPDDNINMRIVDFGCGRDGLFLERLAKLFSERDTSGTATVFAVDAKPYAGAAALTTAGSRPVDGIGDDHTKFNCTNVSVDCGGKGDWNTNIGPEVTRGSVDVAAFCLSLMAAMRCPLDLPLPHTS